MQCILLPQEVLLSSHLALLSFPKAFGCLLLESPGLSRKDHKLSTKQRIGLYPKYQSKYSTCTFATATNTFAIGVYSLKILMRNGFCQTYKTNWTFYPDSSSNTRLACVNKGPLQAPLEEGTSKNLGSRPVLRPVWLSCKCYMQAGKTWIGLPLHCYPHCPP